MEDEDPNNLIESLKFQYAEENFVWEIPASNEVSATQQWSRFDKLLCHSWDHAMNKDYFNYNLDHVQTKILDGSIGFVAQMNCKRATERRKPLPFQSVTQPFNPSQFNFTKIKRQEVLFELVPLSSQSEHLNIDTGNEGPKSGHYLIINVSPLEYCNSLLVPQLSLCQPQILTKAALKLAVELLLQSSQIGFRLVFNSLCGYASVNHLHFHAYYLNYELPTESLKIWSLAGDCYETQDYPASAFVFQLVNRDIPRLVGSVMKTVDYFLENNIPHNLFLTRGVKCGEEKTASRSTVRVYLWVKSPILGCKTEDAFNAASCELGGHLVLKTEEIFNSITEEEVCQILRDSSEQKFTEVQPHVKKLFL